MKKTQACVWLLLLSACSPSLLPGTKNNFIVIAHRGAHTQAPENTLRAFENAIALGVDYVEVDVRTSSDSVLLVMHDSAVDRMTDGSGLLDTMSSRELDTLHVYNKEHPEYGRHPIPRLADVLALCKNKVKIYLDFKDADVSATIDIFKKYQMIESMVVYINDEDQYKSWRRLAPQVPLIVSLPDSVTSSNTLSHFLDKVDAEILDGHFSRYTPAMVKVASKRGRIIWADIQQKNENSELWEQAIETRLHGLQTDNPLSLIQYLKSKGLR